MASLCKRCRHPRAEWDACGCTFYIRRKVSGRVTYLRAGPDRPTAERQLARFNATPQETMAEAVEAWIASKVREPGARPNSIHVYRSRAKHVRQQLGAIPVASLRPHNLTQLADDLLAQGFAPATVQGIYHVATATLRHARRRGVIRTLPFPVDGPGIPTPKERRHDLTLAQVVDIIDAMPGRWGQVAELVVLTGLRWGEAVAIRPEDVDGAVLHVRATANRYGGTNDPKTATGARVVPLSVRAQALLRQMRLPVGGDYREARKALVAAMGALHRPGMGWHSLRAAHATLLDVAGISLREAAARMGHGARTAQTLGYRVRSEAGKADVIDLALRRASGARGH
jgi:integrase